MWQKSSKLNTISVLGYGFVIDTNYNLDIYDGIKDYVKEYNKNNQTNIFVILMNIHI